MGKGAIGLVLSSSSNWVNRDATVIQWSRCLSWNTLQLPHWWYSTTARRSQTATHMINLMPQMHRSVVKIFSHCKESCWTLQVQNWIEYESLAWDLNIAIKFCLNWMNHHLLNISCFRNGRNGTLNWIKNYFVQTIFNTNCCFIVSPLSVDIRPFKSWLQSQSSEKNKMQQWIISIDD